MLILAAAATAAALSLSSLPLAHRAVAEAICDEIDHGISATKAKDMDQYMESVPDDYRIVEDDGSVTDRAKLREKQLQAWAIIPRTNALEIVMTKIEVGCAGECAKVWTDQRWDRQMTGRDGKSEHVVVTTQKHIEQWALRGSRWVQTGIEELGGTTVVDGKVY